MKKILLLLLLPFFSSSYGQERARLDSLLNRLNNDYRNRQDTAKVDLLTQVAINYSPINTDSGSAYMSKALQLSRQLGDKFREAVCYYLEGASNFGHNVSDLLKALALFEQLNDKAHVAMVLDQIAGEYYNMERYAQALVYFERALEFYEKVKDTYNTARTKGNIAETHGLLGNFSKALTLQLSVLPYFEKNGYHDRAALALSDIGNAYLGLKEYNKALVYASRAVRLFNSMHRDSSHQFAFALSDMGHIYFTAANEATGKIHPDSLLPAGRKEKLDKAIFYYTAAHQVHIRNPHFIPTNIALRLANALEASGQFEAAIRYYREHTAFKDSMLSENTRLKVSAAETMRETDLKDRQIAIKKRERWLFGTSLALLAIVVVLVWRNNNWQKRTNAVLAEEKLKLEAANKYAAEKKENAEALAVNLQESLVQKDALTANLQESLVQKDALAATLQESLVQKDALASQLSQAADMKTRFLANISHELRTPVTLLAGMMELMNERAGLKDRQLQVAYNNSRKLQYMVEEILDLSRMETSEAKMHVESREIAPLLNRMVYAFETFIVKEQLSLSFNERNTQGVCVSVDENMLEKVVNNLVYNAIKFNEPGGWIKTNIFLSDDGKEFIFLIANSGSGIKAEDLPHIFERFYQGNTNTPKAEGVGIGLSLVQEFTSLMGGRVDVTSSRELGTAFTLRFPVVSQLALRPSTDLTDTELPEKVWDQFTSKQTVLIVEDNAEMRYYLREVLAGKVDLAEACNGREALDWLKEKTADLVITDLMMPVMDGEELITHLKSADAYKKIPVIMLTALADTKNQLNMLRLGIDDYIVKPFSAPELRVRVYNLLHNLEERRRFDAAPVDPDDIPIESPEAQMFRERIIAFVLKRIRNSGVSVYDLAFELGMSERQLYRLAKTLTGCTPAQLVKEVRLQKAYELLLGGTIQKVADLTKQVGFEDIDYFARQFYDRFGKRPTDFL
jgi:signal transduction histidine kinase/DNA-binding NarL/FixJ family response regulator